MSDENEVEVEVFNYIKQKDQSTVDVGNSPEFQEFIRSLEEQAERGEALSNVIATAVMTLFSPGFVVIGSPFMSNGEDGFMMPDDVGICMSTSNDLTPTNLAHILSTLGEAIINDSDAVFDALKDENDAN